MYKKQKTKETIMRLSKKNKVIRMEKFYEVGFDV